MVLFQNSGGVRAEFSETRHLSILEAAIESEGALYFSPPDRLARHTTQPGRSSLVVNGNRVTLRDETGERTLSLGSSELASGLVNSFAVLLRGDLEALRDGYEVKLHSPKGQAASGAFSWTLDLEPRSITVRRLIERIRVQGMGERLTLMETLETNGDRTVMVFSGVETGLTFDAEQVERLFFVPNSDTAP